MFSSECVEKHLIAANCPYVSGFWGLRPHFDPRSSPGLRLWTTLGDFRPSDPLCPPWLQSLASPLTPRGVNRARQVPVIIHDNTLSAYKTQRRNVFVTVTQLPILSIGSPQRRAWWCTRVAARARVCVWSFLFIKISSKVINGFWWMFGKMWCKLSDPAFLQDPDSKIFQ